MLLTILVLFLQMGSVNQFVWETKASLGLTADIVTYFVVTAQLLVNFAVPILISRRHRSEAAKMIPCCR